MYKRIALAFLLSAALLLSACGVPASGSDTSAAGDPDMTAEAEGAYVALSAIGADFEQTVQDINAGKYPNLSGTVSSPRPEVTALSTVELIDRDRFSNFAEFAAAAEAFFGQFQECKPEYVVVPASGARPEVTLAEIRESGAESRYDDAGAFLFDGEYVAGEMQFTRHFVALWTNRGGIAAVNPDLRPHPGIFSYGGAVYDFRAGAATDTVVTLSGQPVSFADAIAVFDREINQNYFLPDPNPELTYQVHGIMVCDITDSVQALKLLCRRVYRGIPFDEFYGEGGKYRDVPGMGRYNMSGIAMANAMMISPDTLDTTVNVSRMYETVPGEPIEQMLPASAAVQMISDELTTATTFNVECVELVYIAAPEDADADAAAAEDGADSGLIMRPVWKLRAINPNNNARYS